MKIERFIKAALCLLPLFLSGQAYTQPSSATTDATSAASSGMSKSRAAKATNRQLATEVHRKLNNARSQGLAGAYIKVRANAGVVTLSGVVVDASQIPLAVSIAKNVAGVSAVNVKLKVGREEGMTATQ